MAKRFIEENYYTSFKNDFIKDYMLTIIHTLQVLSCGKNKILHCDDHINSIINKAIASYLEYDWSEIIMPNPTNF